MMNPAELRSFYNRELTDILADRELAAAHESLLGHLEQGAVRAAERDPAGEWRAVAWVKRAILVGFRTTPTEPVDGWGSPCFDRTAFPPRHLTPADGVRLVPGGSCIRRGAHVAAGVVIMPPAYLNVGAWVGEGALIDSHALVGSCAQVGRRVHVSAGAQLGGVLEPAGARPVVVEDDAFVGGLCGLFEGVVVRRRAVVAAGVVLTAATPVMDPASGREWRGEVPEGAVVVAGARPYRGPGTSAAGLALAAAVVVKYRDDRTDAATALEEALR